MKPDFDQNYRLTIVKYLTPVITVFVWIYFLIDFTRDIPLIYSFEFMFGLFGVISCLKFNKWVTQDNLTTFSLIFTNILFIFLLLTLYVHGLSNTGHLWILSIPVASYMMRGLKSGLKFTIFYLTLSVLMLVYKQLTDYVDISFTHYLDIISLFIVFWVFGHYYEKLTLDSKNSLIKLATKDFLTNLNNRRIFYNIFTKNQNQDTALIMIDLDFFKKINDTYGHDCGDYVLVEVANVLTQFESNSVYAFRLGGEEFAILSISLNNEQVYTLTNDILVALRENSYNYKTNAFRVTASIGVAMSTNGNANLDELTKNADARLYKAKEDGRDRIVFTD